MSKEVSDVEIVMHLFRLMRSGNYNTAKALLESAAIDFPDVPEERLKKCAIEMATRMMRHG